MNTLRLVNITMVRTVPCSPERCHSCLPLPACRTLSVSDVLQIGDFMKPTAYTGQRFESAFSGFDVLYGISMHVSTFVGVYTHIFDRPPGEASCLTRGNVGYAWLSGSNGENIALCPICAFSPTKPEDRTPHASHTFWRRFDTWVATLQICGTWGSRKYQIQI
jgi:hypothetical protein